MISVEQMLSAHLLCLLRSLALAVEWNFMHEYV